MGENLTRINIIIDKRCNQKCRYCEHAHAKYKKRSDEEIYSSFDSVMNKLEELFKGERIRPQLQGGELTILSDKLIDKICDRLKGYDEVLVFSNGYNRNSRLYKEKGYKVVTHIIDWYEFDISKFPQMDNETLAFCITHDEIHRVKKLLETATGKEKILLLPCWSDNLKWNCTMEDKSYLAGLQRKYDGEKSIIKDEAELQKICSSMRIPLVDCTDQSITPCGFIPDPEPIFSVQMEYFKNKECTANCGRGCQE